MNKNCNTDLCLRYIKYANTPCISNICYFILNLKDYIKCK